MEDILESLIDRAKNGCSDSFSHIFESYKPIVLKMQRQYFLINYDTDDWLQEGRIICYQSIRKYNPDKGATFGSFFRMNFRNHIFSLLRKQEAYKRKVDKESVTTRIDIEDLDASVPRIDGRPLENVKYIFYKENILLFSESLSEYERNVFIKYTTEEDCQNIKDKRALARVKKKFIDYYINE